ncbi:TonB-dependent receptor plug domain-containing protein [Flavobacterium sp.]|uniref:TonB-dependent receptor plug domain-containing protein n=1 Tax=Flavobacterium sp. TaxID=239 RepID=UPI0039E48F88
MKKIVILLLMAVVSGVAYAQEIPKDSLSESHEEIDEVIIQSTRTSRTIRNTPTRIETIDGEELDEKANMQARSGITMALHESTGLQVQQTSATSGNASIRVQGLDGRYTQLLKDGYPNFGNFSSGLSLLEIPPLDLKQVEIIKGPASTLYGGGAIAGAINFVSKTPKEKAEYLFFVNQSHLGQTNMGAYLSQKKGRFGYSLLLMNNLQKAYDIDDDDFSELPKSNTFTINPRLFFYPTESTTLMLGNSFTKGNMKGGDMNVIDGHPDILHTYFEKNETIRNITTLEFDKRFANKNTFKFKQSLSVFDRKINIPNYEFDGKNTNAYSDVSYVINKEFHTLIGGINFVYDDFKQDSGLHDSRSFTSGAYLQHTWDMTKNVKLENGLRIDYVDYNELSKNQLFVLPRLSTLFKINNQWSSRIGGGLGYKLPSIFTEKTEEMQYRNLAVLSHVRPERSIGGTADVNYKASLATDFVFSLNQMFFLTKIERPLVLQQDGFGTNELVNASRPILSHGFETNLKFIYREDFKLFAGYTFTDAKAEYLSGNQFLPITPKHKVNLALIHEKENNFKFGLEGYFTDKQFLTNGLATASFWELGFMAQKTLWDHFDFFINFENFTDVKQSDYKRVVNEPHNNPTFDEIWTHTEGFVFNGGVKIRF